MRVAVVGMGVAGSYLASRLSGSHEVVGFERMKGGNFDSICAWGSSSFPMSEFTARCGLRFEDYILHKGKVMYVELKDEMIEIKLKGLCSFDKPRLLSDIQKGIKVNYGSEVTGHELLHDHDLLVDATGPQRRLLPRPKKQYFIPCLQYKVKYAKGLPFDDFFIKPFAGLTGYLWLFPLGENYAHVGAGDFKRAHIEALHSFLSKFPGEVVKKVGRALRIMPPSMCEPFFNGRVVGVGEAIGTVYPLLGEGVVPSLQCADLLVENVDDLEGYRRKVIERFKIYEKVFRLVRAKNEGSFSPKKDFLSLLSIYMHMKGNEKRFGMEIRMQDWRKVLSL